MLKLLVVLSKCREMPNIHRRVRHLDPTLVGNGVLKQRQQIEALVKKMTIVNFKATGERWQRLAKNLNIRRFGCSDHSPRFFDLICADAPSPEKTFVKQTTKNRHLYGW